MYDITGAVSLWDHLAETSKPIIIYGMGDGAQKILDVCSLKNVKISGFMASDDFVRIKRIKVYCKPKPLVSVTIKSCTFVTMPRAARLPRSVSLLTTNSAMSTQ